MVHDACGGQVRQNAFEPFGHFDAHAPVVLRHDQQHTIAYVTPADLPGAGHTIGVGRNVFGVCGGYHQYHDLAALGLLVGFKRGFQRDPVGFGEGARLVNDARRQGRNGQHILLCQSHVWQTEQQHSYHGTAQPAQPEGKQPPPGVWRSCVSQHASLLRQKGHFFSVPKSTVGGREMAASFSTVKLGLAL